MGDEADFQELPDETGPRELSDEAAANMIYEIGVLFGIKTPQHWSVRSQLTGESEFHVWGEILGAKTEATAPTLHEATRLFIEDLTKVKAWEQWRRDTNASYVLRPAGGSAARIGDI